MSKIDFIIKKRKAYIDIDGVLLTKQSQIPKYGEEFIFFLIKNYDCYWLTTHCRHGVNNSI